MRLCIGICTFNRVESLKKLVSQIKTFTAAEYELIIGDGDSQDGTAAWCIENGIRVLNGPNRGIAAGKNQMLYWFLHHTTCDQIIILEDDCRVWERGWEQEWMLCCKAWDHVNWPLCPTNTYEFGDNTAGSPIRTNWFGGHCTITSRSALEKVGYLDPRFVGYGGEHAEWTWRFYRLLKDKWGEPCSVNNTVPCLSNHVGVEFADSKMESGIYRKNLALMHKLLEEDPSIYREPWLDEEERVEFMQRIENAKLVKEVTFGVAGERCPLCNGLGGLVGTKDGVEIRQCCGILLAWAWNNERDYERLYTDDALYHVGQQRAEGQQPYWERDSELMAAGFMRLRFLQTLRPHAKTLLDVGAGTGAFVDAATRLGFDAVGLEPNTGMAEKARQLGRKIKVGTWKDADWRFDYITLIDVFEHLTRPKECLTALKDHVHANGLIYVEMPEAGSAENNRHGLAWKHVRPRQHVAIYSDDAARRLFYICGLHPEFIYRPVQGKLGKIGYALSPVA